MGNASGVQKKYAVETTEPSCKDESPIYRSSECPGELISNFETETIKNEWELFLRGFKLAKGNSRCLGYRARNPNTGVLNNHYTWLSYQKVHDLSLILGTNLQNVAGTCLQPIKFEEEGYAPAQSMAFMGLYSKNCVEWFVTELAAAAYNWTLVPLYDSLSLEGLVHIFRQTRMSIMSCSLECLSVVMESAKSVNCLKKVIVFLHENERISEEDKAKAQETDIELIPYTDLINPPSSGVLPPQPGTLESVNTLCYTSGTTGLPKGVLLTNQNLISCAAAVGLGPGKDFLILDHRDTTISYLPLAHVLERLVSCYLLAIGASTGLYSGDPNILLEDIEFLEPTVFVSVPRLFNRINDAILRSVSEKAPISRFLFSQATSTKLNKLRQSAATTSFVWDPLVFAKTKKLMGNRLRYMISGGAPLDPMVQEHMKVFFCVPLMEGYGLTETFGPSFLASTKDSVVGHVGGVLPCIEFKLVSIPDLNYLVTDTPARGELLLRGPAISVGYFLNPELNKGVFDEDGWFHTGDVIVLLPNGAIKIIDRVKNVFKLAQGEYVSPEKLELVYTQCPLINQIFVTGLSNQAYLVAIIVPDEAGVSAWIKRNNFTQENNETHLEELKTAILLEMDTAVKTNHLKGFEKVKKIHIETTPFSIENNLLTPTMKLRRHLAQLKYKNKINELYEINNTILS